MVGSEVTTRSSIEVIERTDRRVRFELRTQFLKGGPTSTIPGSVSFEPDGARVRARYELDFRSWSALARMANLVVCFVYGGVFIVGAPLLIWLLAIPSDDPAVRNQTFQVFQMVHGVWPPFLLGHVWRRERERVERWLATTIRNLRALG